MLTGKGTRLDAGLLLTGSVVVTTVHATRDVRRRNGLPAIARYGAVPLVFLPSIAVYAAVYEAITAAMAGLPVVTAPTAVTVVHAIVGAAFLVAYVAIETGWYRISDRLYVAFLNVTQAPRRTQTPSREEYDEY